MKLSEQGHGFFYPLVFPFYQKNWFSRIWWLVLLAVVPILDFIFLRGWRLQLVRNMANSQVQKKHANILPNAEIGTFFFNGLVLWFMTFIYLVIPTIIIFSFGAGEIGSLFQMLSWVFAHLFQGGLSKI